MFGSGFMQPRGPGTIPQDFDNPFGLPQFDVPDFGGPTSIPTASPKKGGMFGSGMGAKEVLGRLISGYLAGRGNPVGSIGLHMINQRRNLAQQQELAAQDRENNFQDFVRREAWQIANKPQNEDEFTAMMRRAGVDPNSPEGQAAYQQAFQNRMNPFVAMTVQNPDGSERREFVRPPMMGFGQPAIGSVVEDPRQGGPMPSASGGFPRPY